MWENKIYEGIHYSRFIASWYNAGGNPERGDFVDWLQSLVINGKNIPYSVIHEIANLMEDGKLELEQHVKQWLKNN